MIPIQRKSEAISAAEAVRTRQLNQVHGLPVLMEPTVSGVDLESWLGANRETVEHVLFRHGGVLLRGFEVLSIAAFERMIEGAFGGLLEYTNRSTPRTQVSGKVYTSTEFPANRTIPQHNEMSYTAEWPLKIAFLCVQTAACGGETPIADSRRVFERIAPEIRARFERLGVMYVRNYGFGIDLPWNEAFGTTNKSELEQILDRSGIQYEWISPKRLRTRQVCQGTARHPHTNEMVWFNQAHLFHVSNLERELREQLLAAFREEDLPRNAYYGDGSPIESEVLDHIREAYQSETVDFPWNNGDLLLLDNMLASHGRNPFEGSRKVVVTMTQSYRVQ